MNKERYSTLDEDKMIHHEKRIFEILKNRSLHKNC